MRERGRPAEGLHFLPAEVFLRIPGRPKRLAFLVFALGVGVCLIGTRPSLRPRPATAVRNGFSFYLLRGQSAPNPALLADAATKDGDAARISTECRSLWMESILLDLTPYAEKKPGRAPTSGVVTLRLADAAGARTALKQILARHVCVGLPESVAFTGLRESTMRLRAACEEKEPIACVTAATWLRLHATRYFTRHFTLSDLHDVGTLVHLLFATTLAGEASDVPDSAAIAERILELDPHLLDAARAAAQLRYVDFVWNHARPESEDALESALAAAEQAERAAGSASPLLAELRVAKALAKDDNKAWREAAQNLRLRFPKSGLGDYYLGWLAFRQGNLGEAARELSEATRRESPAPCWRIAWANRQLSDLHGAVPESMIFRDDAGNFGLQVHDTSRGPSSLSLAKVWMAAW